MPIILFFYTQSSANNIVPVSIAIISLLTVTLLAKSVQWIACALKINGCKLEMQIKDILFLPS